VQLLVVEQTKQKNIYIIVEEIRRLDKAFGTIDWLLKELVATVDWQAVFLEVIEGDRLAGHVGELLDLNSHRIEFVQLVIGHEAVL